MARGREQKEVASMEGICIVVPVRVRELRTLQGFAEHYKKLAAECSGDLALEVLVVDSSCQPIYQALDDQLKGSGILHFTTANCPKPGESHKLDHIQVALGKASMPYIALLDDDARPTKELLLAVVEKLKHHGVVKCMIAFDEPDLYDLIDLVGIYVINVVSPDRQFYANVWLHRELLTPDAFFRKDVLYDDLAVYRHCRSRAARRNQRGCGNPWLEAGYVADPPLKVVASARTLRSFLLQRLRWAYENAAYPVRFAFYLSIFPIVGFLAWFWSWGAGAVFVAILTAWVAMLALWGQMRYKPRECGRWAWLLAPLWFWLYPLMSWISIWYAVVGCPFAGARLRRPCIFPRWWDWFSW